MLRTIPKDVDIELRAIAERSASQYSDRLLHALGWTRPKFVAAIHTRLRNKYRLLRDEGRLIRDANGQIRFNEGAL